MGKDTISKRISVSGEKGEGAYEILFDTGATKSLVRYDIAEKLCNIEKFVSLEPPSKFNLADGKNFLEANFLVNLFIRIDGYKLPYHFYVVNKMSRDVIVGLDFMQSWEIGIDFKEKEITLGLKPDELFLY